MVYRYVEGLGGWNGSNGAQRKAQTLVNRILFPLLVLLPRIMSAVVSIVLRIPFPSHR